MNARLALLAVVLLILAPLSALAGTVYENGPINGTTDAWTINSGFAVADTFTISSGNTPMTGLSFGTWLFPGDVLESVEVSMTSNPFGGTTYFDQVVNFSQSGCVLNQYGYNVCTESGSFNGPTLANGTYWLTLQNAVVSNNDPVYWDENSGIGCHSQGCPSAATCNDCIVPGGNLPSESFTLEGGTAGTVPEPSSIVMLGSGVLGVIGWLRRKRF